MKVVENSSKIPPPPGISAARATDFYQLKPHGRLLKCSNCGDLGTTSHRNLSSTGKQIYAPPSHDGADHIAPFSFSRLRLGNRAPALIACSREGTPPPNGIGFLPATLWDLLQHHRYTEGDHRLKGLLIRQVTMTGRVRSQLEGNQDITLT